MAQTVEVRGFDELQKSWDALLKTFPEEKRRMLQGIGKDLLQQVRREIGGEGKVAGWHEAHMGSGGGYVAVRARAREFQTTQSGKRYAVGYITNAIEGGHRTAGRHSGPKAKGYRYRPRDKIPAVPGRWFYADVRERLESMTQDDIRELLGTIVDGLEGRL